MVHATGDGPNPRYFRMIDWRRAQIQLPGGYKAQSLYHGEGCQILAALVPPGAGGLSRHTHPCDQTYFLLQGQLQIELGSDRRTARKNTIVFVPAGLPHQNRNAGSEDEIHLEVLAPGLRPGLPTYELTESTDAKSLRAVVRELDEAKLAAGGFTQDWLLTRDSGAMHATLYVGQVLPGASGPPLHIHRFDQFYLVLSGRLHVEIALDRHVAERHTLVVIPAGVPHRQWNEGPEVERHLTMLVPEPATPRPWDTTVSFEKTGDYIG